MLIYYPEKLGLLHNKHYSIIIIVHKMPLLENKPDAQAAGADPSQCIFTDRQSPSIQQNRHNS